MKWNSRKLLLTACIGLLCISGCSRSKEQLEETKTPSQNVLAPFTGEQITEGLQNRPIVATINNHPLARPQSGIAEADQVYEFLAEGNVTRFAAIFQSEIPNQMGPIRSAREYFVDFADGMDAFFIAHGYSPDAKKLLDGGVVDHVNGMQYDGSLFERSSDRKAPHNSYISKEHIEEAFEKTNASEKISKTPTFSFLKPEESDKIGDIASSITVSYSSDPRFISTYRYDEEKNRYYRSVNGIDTVDKLNERRVELSNVVVMEMDHQTVDQQGRLAINLQSGGNAMLFHEGITREIEWENRDGFLIPIEQGVPVKLTVGRTWIHIVPSLSSPSAAVTYTP
ncbi:DUF3048 domain-containing protein [Sporosarcina sp. GW1-11]|uniref:DUF3048 domain-containing protein n=1 Tax=Sporosarcina sp. GW1-11 TaxID=2899126 RepID=UPI00294FAB21|nr:DUF3048 domain-containing protein [Sporosarcina sp. GW1-11]MDV6377734.1 DUF3048 domain-containing protein [Sporosarcina sp. GW1-11]